MSDRIVVMSEGRIEQVGTPFEIYNFPKTRFVASFVGTLSILAAKVADPAGGAVLIEGQQAIAGRGLAGFAAGDACTLALRPESLQLGEGALERNRLRGVIEEVGFLGSVVRVRVKLGEARVSLDMFNNPSRSVPAIGETAVVNFSREDLLVLDAKAG